MSLAVFDFHDSWNIRVFWVIVFLSLFLLFASSSFLYVKFKEEKDIEEQIHKDNESSIFVAPPEILNPQAVFKPLGPYVDSLPFEDAEMPPAVAPENILDPSWSAKFTKPNTTNL